MWAKDAADMVVGNRIRDSRRLRSHSEAVGMEEDVAFREGVSLTRTDRFDRGRPESGDRVGRLLPASAED